MLIFLKISWSDIITINFLYNALSKNEKLIRNLFYAFYLFFHIENYYCPVSLYRQLHDSVYNIYNESKKAV